MPTAAHEHTHVEELLDQLTRFMTENEASPSVVASPDYELLCLCDVITHIRREAAYFEKLYRETALPSDEDEFLQREARAGDLAASMKYASHQAERRSLRAQWLAAERGLRSPINRLARLKAQTPAGIFAKAAVLRLTMHAAHLGQSLADDIVNCAGLRQAIWPVNAGS